MASREDALEALCAEYERLLSDAPVLIIDRAVARLTEDTAALQYADAILAWKLRYDALMKQAPESRPTHMTPGNFQVVAGFDEAGAWYVGIKFTMPGREDVLLRLDEVGAAVLARDVTGACEAIAQHRAPAKH